MFYSDSILARKGPLANIWLAAHWDRRLSKSQVVTTNIETSVRDIICGTLPPMALRLSGQLLLGVTKIYGRKAKYLLEDCADALGRLKLAFRKGNVDLPAHASKASHAAITMPTVANPDDALAPEPELDLEESVVDTDRPVMNSLNQRLQQRNLDIDVGRMNLGLPTLRESELPSELQMEVEAGRRLTFNSTDMNLPRPSVEAGRRAESPRQSLPFSPLRTPIKTVDFDQVPLNDDFGYFEEPNMMVEERRESDLQPIDLEVTREVVRARPERSSRIPRRRAVKIDEEVELSNVFNQELIRDPTPLLLSRPNWKDNCLSEYLGLLSPKFSKDTRADKHNDPVQQAIDDEKRHEEPTPLDDDYLIGPADYAMDGSIMRSPKSPRIMPISDSDENAVPEVNQGVPGGTPTKARAENVGLAEITVESLSRWQKMLDLDKSVSFSALVFAPGNRKQAANTFLQVLVLHTKGLIKAEQLLPFDTISIAATEKLFSTAPNIVVV